MTNSASQKRMKKPSDSILFFKICFNLLFRVFTAGGTESMENSMDIQQQQQDKQHNNSQTQNIKESTARNIHAFSGLELSSIVESASTSKFEDSHGYCSIQKQ